MVANTENILPPSFDHTANSSEVEPASQISIILNESDTEVSPKPSFTPDSKVTSTPVPSRNLSTFKDSGIDSSNPESDKRFPVVLQPSKHVTFNLPPVEVNNDPCHCILTVDGTTRTAVLEVNPIRTNDVPPLSYQEAQRNYNIIISHPYNPLC